MTPTLTPALRQSMTYIIESIRRDRMMGFALGAWSDAKLLLSYANRTKNKRIISLAMRILNECRVALRNSPLCKAFAA